MRTRIASALGLAASVVAAASCAKKVGENDLAMTFSTGDRAHLAVARFLPGARSVVTAAADGVIRVWDLETGRQTAALALPGPSTLEVMSVGVSPDGSMLLAGHVDGSAAVWNLVDGTLVHQWKAHAQPIHGAEISPDGTIGATGSDDGTARLWSLPDATPIRTLTGHESWVGRIKFSPDGRRLLTPSADGTLRVWDVGTGELLQVLRGHEAWVRSGVFLAGGERVLSGGYDLELREWDVASGRTTRTMGGPTGMIYEVAASADARWAIAVESDSTVSLYDLSSGSRVHEYATAWRPRPSSACGDISPDGRWAVAGDWDAVVYLWDLRPAQEAWERTRGGR